MLNKQNMNTSKQNMNTKKRKVEDAEISEISVPKKQIVLTSKQLNALRQLKNWHHENEFKGRFDAMDDPTSDMVTLEELCEDANIAYRVCGDVDKWIEYDENADTIRTFLEQERSSTEPPATTNTSPQYTKATFDALVERWETKLGENKHYFAKKGDAVTMRKYFFSTRREQKENEKDFFYFEILQDVEHDPKIIRKMMEDIEQWLEKAFALRKEGKIQTEVLVHARTVYHQTKHRFPFKIRTWKRADSNWNGHEFDLMRKKEGTRDAYWCLQIMQVVSHCFDRCSNEIKRTRNWYLPPIKLPNNAPPKKTDSWTIGDLVLQTTTNTGFSDRDVHVEELFTVHKVTPKTLCLFPVTIDEKGKVVLSKDVEDNRDTSKMVRVNKQEGRTLRGSQTSIRYFDYEYYDYHAKQTHELRRYVEENPI